MKFAVLALLGLVKVQAKTPMTEAEASIFMQVKGLQLSSDPYQSALNVIHNCDGKGEGGVIDSKLTQQELAACFQEGEPESKRASNNRAARYVVNKYDTNQDGFLTAHELWKFFNKRRNTLLAEEEGSSESTETGSGSTEEAQPEASGESTESNAAPEESTSTGESTESGSGNTEEAQPESSESSGEAQPAETTPASSEETQPAEGSQTSGDANAPAAESGNTQADPQES